jgi:hypothetical protein
MMPGCANKQVEEMTQEDVVLEETTKNEISEKETFEKITGSESTLEPSLDEKIETQFSKADIQATIAEWILETEEEIQRLDKLESAARNEVQNSFLKTLQTYYMMKDEYTTEEETIGSLITSSVADQLSGGSSTVSSAIVSAANSIKKGDSAEELITNTFSSAMNELPQEISSRVFEYLVGETVLKGFKIIEALIPQNEQTQHLANLMDNDLKKEICELSSICSNKQLSSDDCYKGIALCDSILQKTYEVEIITGVNAGSYAWRPFYLNDGYGNYIQEELSEVVDFEEKKKAAELKLEVLYNLDIDDIQKYTPESWEDYRNRLSTFFNEGSGSSLYALQSTDENIKGMYDLEEAARKSKNTNVMNTVGKLLGNPIADIYMLKNNQKEEILANALADFNAQAISLWRERFVPIKSKVEELNEKKNLFNGDIDIKEKTEVKTAIRMAALEYLWGEDPSLEIFKEEIAPLMKDIRALLTMTQIMHDTYYVTLSDSENNRLFLKDYYWAKKDLNDFLEKNYSLIDYRDCEAYFRINSTYFDNDCKEMALLSYEVIQLYEDNVEKSSDLIKSDEINTICAGQPVQCSALIKQPVNGQERPYLVKLSVSQPDVGCLDFYYLFGGMPYYIFDRTNNKSYYLGNLATSDLYRDLSNSPDDITEKDIKTERAETLAEKFRQACSWSSWSIDFTKDLDVDLGFFFNADLEEYREAIRDYQERIALQNKNEQELSALYQSIQKEVEENPNSLWMNPDELIDLFVKSYIPNGAYDEYCEWKLEDSLEEAGFGNLTLIQKWNENQSAIYKTSNGTDITINVYHPMDPFSEKYYVYWCPKWSYGNYVTNNNITDIINDMRKYIK